ncbi:14181_t:CDS:2, partial [Gigaspora margarita]
KGCKREVLSIYLAKYLVNSLYVKISIKRAYQICSEKKVDILRLQVAEGHYNKKEYKKAWTIFSEIDTCKFKTNQCSIDTHNKVKFTARFWMTIYILEEYYRPLANAFCTRKKFTEGWKLLSDLNKSNTEYKYGAKYLIALNSLKDSHPGFKKDKELAYKNYKEISDYSSSGKDYFISKISDSYLCIKFSLDVQPILSICQLLSYMYTIYSF